MNDILRLCKDHIEATRSDYRSIGFDESAELGNIWRLNVQRFLSGIISRDDTSTTEVMSELNSRAFYDFTVTEPLITPSIKWYANLLAHHYTVTLDEMAPALAESRFISDERCVTSNGRRLSSDFLYRLCQVHYLLHRQAVSDSQTVLEVGAGYGALARTILVSMPSVRYVIVDIPETLFFAELYLRSEFPDRAVAFVGKDTTKEEIQAADIVFVPTGFRDRIDGCHVDLAINTNSLGEMPLTVARGIINWLVDTVQPVRLYSLNRFLNRVTPWLLHQRIEASGCNFLWGKKWQVLDWEVPPCFERCPYYMSIMTRNLCLLLTHRPSGATFDETSAAHRLSDIELQDWYRRPYWDDFVLKPNGERLSLMSKINPDLTADLTLNGALFNLWDTMRLSDSKQLSDRAAGLLKAYLVLLGGTSEPFEDLLFFWQQEMRETGERVHAVSAGGRITRRWKRFRAEREAIRYIRGLSGGSSGRS